MPDSLESGVNDRSPLLIDRNNRLHSSSVTIQENFQANKDGQAFNLNTKNFILTNDRPRQKRN